MSDPVQTHPVTLSFRIWSLLLTRLVRNYEHHPENFSLRVLSFKVTQSHWNRHGSIGSSPRIFNAPLWGCPWNFVTAEGSKKRE